MNQDEVLSAIKTLKIKREEVFKQVESLDVAIASLESIFGNTYNVPKVVRNEDGLGRYDKKWGYTQKVLYVLKEQQRFLHFRQIAKIILELDEVKVDKASITELAKTLSTSCQNIKKSKMIVRYQSNESKSNQSFYWGSPKWIDENGKIKEGYELIEDHSEKTNKLQGEFEL